MHPEVPDGAKAVFSKSEKPVAGDLVVVWYAPRILKPGDLPCATKRLVMAPPPWVKRFPYADHPESNVHALLMVEQLNPARQYGILCSEIIALHKFLGVQSFTIGR